MSALSGVTSLLMNLETMTAAPRADGDSKDCVPWEIEKVVCYFIHTDKRREISQSKFLNVFKRLGITGAEMEKVIPDKTKSGTFVPTMAFARMLFFKIHRQW